MHANPAVLTIASSAWLMGESSLASSPNCNRPQIDACRQCRSTFQTTVSFWMIGVACTFQANTDSFFYLPCYWIQVYWVQKTISETVYIYIYVYAMVFSGKSLGCFAIVSVPGWPGSQRQKGTQCAIISILKTAQSKLLLCQASIVEIEVRQVQQTKIKALWLWPNGLLPRTRNRYDRYDVCVSITRSSKKIPCLSRHLSASYRPRLANSSKAQHIPLLQMEPHSVACRIVASSAGRSEVWFSKATTKYDRWSSDFKWLQVASSDFKCQLEKRRRSKPENHVKSRTWNDSNSSDSSLDIWGWPAIPKSFLVTSVADLRVQMWNTK